MTWNEKTRIKRRHHAAGKSDQRDPFQTDRDRILYCSAFRRLSGITQVVRAGESDVFHNRLVHSLKVAQLGRRLAQHIKIKQPSEAALLGVDEEVVEAACLAHDLGHPPFGHAGEVCLNNQVLYSPAEPLETGGFEGNAQSFRIITKLAIRFEIAPGLDLTRATLAACLKYPYTRIAPDSSINKKWGFYESERKDFEFAREGLVGTNKTAEAELMDWADDIAYSVHDMEDFHRCNAVPWHRIFSSEGKEEIVAGAVERYGAKRLDAAGRYREAFESFEEFAKGAVPDLVQAPYQSTREQRLQIRFLTSVLIDRYFNAMTLRKEITPESGERCVEFNGELVDEITILKQITSHFIINNPTISAQQRGQSRILEALFADLSTSDDGRPKYLPIRFNYLFDNIDSSPPTMQRAVADSISSMTEFEATALYKRLSGQESGSVLDPIIR